MKDILRAGDREEFIDVAPAPDHEQRRFPGRPHDPRSRPRRGEGTHAIERGLHRVTHDTGVGVGAEGAPEGCEQAIELRDAIDAQGDRAHTSAGQGVSGGAIFGGRVEHHERGPRRQHGFDIGANPITERRDAAHRVRIFIPARATHE